jgi:dihydroorotase
MARRLQFVLFLLLVAVRLSSQPYDLLLKGGHVIDPEQNLNAIRDVAIRAGKIAAVASGITDSRARKVVNVAGFYVTPGLVDIHADVFTGDNGHVLASGGLSVFPDTFSFRTGVTTVVGAGSSGRRNFAQFKRVVIDYARARVVAFLNNQGGGMTDEATQQNVNDMDARAATDLARAERGSVVGIKVAHYEGPDWTPVERDVTSGTLASIPVMVDFGIFRPEWPFQELVLKKPRPVDIYPTSFWGGCRCSTTTAAYCRICLRRESAA